MVLNVWAIIVNHPLFIELQAHTLKKYLKTEYRFRIFNTAKDYSDMTNFGDCTMPQQIQATCDRLGVECVRCPEYRGDRHDQVSMRHQYALNYLQENYFSKEKGPTLMLDGDLFLMRSLDADYFECDNFYIPQSRFDQEYMWANFWYINFDKTSTNPNWSFQPGFDSGGETRYWLKENQDKNLKKLNHMCSNGWPLKDYPEELSDVYKDIISKDGRNLDGKCYVEIMDRTWFHYRSGSNWTGHSREAHQTNMENMKKILET